MRSPRVVLLVCLLALSVAPVPAGPAVASCAAPSLTTREDAAFSPGAELEVAGTGFVDGCQDGEACTVGIGCSSCAETDPPPEPYQGVALRLAQRGRSWELGVADAGTAEEQTLGRISWSGRIPVGVRPGRAWLVADHAQPVRVRIR